MKRTLRPGDIGMIGILILGAIALTFTLSLIGWALTKPLSPYTVFIGGFMALMSLLYVHELLKVVKLWREKRGK